MAHATDWQALIAAKRADQASRIPAEWILPKEITSQVSPEAPISAFDLLEGTNLLTPREREITEEYDATTLLERMASGELTSVEVTTAFCKRAAIAQQLTNCLTEMFFDKALKRAAECDEYLRRENKPMGPLHGLPVSVKDLFMIEGEAATIGFVSYLTKPVATHNSVFVDMLLEAGAIMYCKTNVPQTLFVCESQNRVFGTTMNPYKLTLTSAGSSSGEGALVGFRGSLLGIGSDIGGSVRAPALCCGTFGFKPSADRLPWGGQQELIPHGWPGVIPSAGPHATSARDLTLLTKIILSAKPWLRDSSAHAIPWRSVPQKAKLTIGLWLGDDEVPVTPPVLRSLKEAAEKLSASGHEVKYLNCPSLVELARVSILGYNLDTNNTVFSYLADGDEEPIPALLELHKNGPDAPVDLQSVWKFVAGREAFLEKWGRIWRENNLDVLLCPGSRQVAPLHGKFGTPWYTSIWNFLDFPATVIPFGRVDKSIDSVPMKESNFPLEYDVNDIEGAPCSVQVVGWKYMDEETLAATEVIADSLNKR